jgi:hypothetical protein
MRRHRRVLFLAAVGVSALNEKSDAQAEGKGDLQPCEPPLRGVVPYQELGNAKGGQEQPAGSEGVGQAP